MKGSSQQPLPAESWLRRTWLPLAACPACGNNIHTYCTPWELREDVLVG